MNKFKDYDIIIIKQLITSVMGFLDGFFPEYPNELQYDANGFLITDNDSQIIRLINSYNNNIDDGYRSDNDDNDENYQTFALHEDVSILIGLTSFTVTETNLSYSYHIHLSYDDGYGHYIAHGDVTITCVKDEQNKKNKRYISDINVNGNHNGALHDKYNDCFDVYPYEYLPILCPNISSNLPLRPDFDDTLNENY